MEIWGGLLYCPHIQFIKIVKINLLPTLLEKFWRISLYLTDDAIAKLYVT